MSKNSSLILAIAVVVSASFSGGTVRAEQIMTRNGQVVHTRVAPVLMHRAVPPYRGVHVYHRSYNRRSR